MKLYYAPGACSQAPHILMHEIGISHDAVRVDLRAKTLEDGSDYLAINPKGAVPAIELDNGEVLTENAVILQYLGDRAADDSAFPGLGSIRRYRVLEWVNFITTELHKSFSPLFSPQAGDETKAFFRQALSKKFDYVDGQLGDGPFLMGDTLTIADPYLFVMCRWGDSMLGLDNWPNLAAFHARMMERESVRNVLRFEGLLQEEPAG
ncbi:MAG: glutathione transferase GstA [Pseudomonadota bacterium]